MLLAIDFHLDPNYAKTSSSYIRKGKRKASTSQFYQFFSVIWVNAPEPITLGVHLIPTEYSTLQRVQDTQQSDILLFSSHFGYAISGPISKHPLIS